MNKLFLFLILFSFKVYSIENKFNYINSEDGLTQGNVTCFFQDHQGFMWIGTFYGLNRYDGYSIKAFYHDPKDSLSLGYGYVSNITEDIHHRLWIGTNLLGFSVYYPEEGFFRNIQRVSIGQDTLQISNVTGILKDSDGNMLVLDQSLGVLKFDADLNLIKTYLRNGTIDSGLPQQEFTAMVYDSNGDLWVGSGNGTLNKLDKGKDKFESYVFEAREANDGDIIRSLYLDEDGLIWIGTSSQGVYSFNPNTKEQVNYQSGTSEYGLSSNTVMGFIDDGNGNILFATDGGGVNIFNKDLKTIDKLKYEIGNPQSLSANAVYCFFIDHSETLWIGTYAGGVNYQGKFKNKFETYRPSATDTNSLSFKNVLSIMEDRDGDIWIGTDGGGLNKYNPRDNSFQRFRANPLNKDWLQADVVKHIMQDKDGDIFIGSYNQGLTIYNKEKNTFKQYLPDALDSNSLNGLNAWFIFQDSYEEIWVGLLSVGLDKFDKETGIFSHYITDINDPKTLKNQTIKLLYEDASKQLWVGTEGGGLHLYNREDDNFTRYFSDPEDSLSLIHDDVRSLYEDSKNRFWVGTVGGLNLMDRNTGTFKIIEGFYGIIINDVLEDDLGILWISTDMGISKYDPDNNTIRNYDLSDGLQSNEFNYSAAMISRQGEFYFGGKDGFSKFRPEDIRDNPHIPEIILTEFYITNNLIEKVLVKKDGEMVSQTVSTTNEINLSYKDNVLEFIFSALDYGNPGKNSYKYMLEGFDDDWIVTSSNKRFANYTNLDGGRYVFRVIGSNSDGIWNNEGLTIHVKVKPPFWKTWWFVTLMTLILIYGVYKYVLGRQQKVIEEKRILQEKIRIGMAEVEKQKEVVAKKDADLIQKIEDEKLHNWFAVGIEKINEVISHNKEDLEDLSNNIIHTIVEYTEVAQGVIYLLNDETEGDFYLEAMAAYAPDDNRIVGTRIEISEGNIGTCYKLKKTVKHDNLPDNYALFTSGLGEYSMNHLVLVPIKFDQEIIGVIELLSFEALEEYKINFIEKIGETLTSILNTLKANHQAKKLIMEQKLLSEESAAQEEELRQNLEELKAIQEQSARKAEELIKTSEEFKVKETSLLEKIEHLEEQLTELK